MIVLEVLTRLGHPLGRAGRTTCPVHRGDNDQEFSYRDGLWHCFACGEGGTAWELAQRLGLIEERRAKPLRKIHGVDMLPPREWEPAPVRPSLRLQRALYETREARREAAILEHQEGFALLRSGERLYALGYEEEGLDLVIDGELVLAAADQVLDCPCGRWSCGSSAGR